MRKTEDHLHANSTEDCSGIEQFHVLGINHNCADAADRGLLAISSEQHIQLLNDFKVAGIKDVIALSTCNRTEIYTYGNADLMGNILAESLNVSQQFIDANTYKKDGNDAVYHLFKVAAGLDSQILGDYEIQGQFKKAAQLSKKKGVLSPLTERLVNYALKASKEIKSNTNISKGTVSVSFAAIEVLKQKVQLKTPEILVVGTGKFGSNIAKNIANYLPHYKLTVTNRTSNKAVKLAADLDINTIDYAVIREVADNYDVIVVCAAADEYVIAPENFKGVNNKLVLDLAVPSGVNPGVKELANVELMNVDEISKLLDKTLERRKAELPNALGIMHDNIKEFVEWHKIYLQRWFLLQVKDTLYDLDELYPPNAEARKELSKDYRVQKAIDKLVVNLKEEESDQKGCQYLSVINNFLDNNKQ